MAYKTPRSSGGTRSIPTPVGGGGRKKRLRKNASGGAVTPTPVRRTKGAGVRKMAGTMKAAKAVARKKK